jgi:RES domain-containing protein
MAWRLVSKEHASSAFSGEGARLFGGRWNSTRNAFSF